MKNKEYLFSDELMKRGQEYFNKFCGRNVSLEETELWLDRLASLYLVFAEI
ncbi:MAG: hypothetical protein WAV31_04810 [Candidatus Moraniibacteriota bacterium]